MRSGRAKPRGDLRYRILEILNRSDDPMWGRQIAFELAEAEGRSARASDEAKGIYKVLRDMAQGGLIRDVETSSSKRPYRITAGGLLALVTHYVRQGLETHCDSTEARTERVDDMLIELQSLLEARAKAGGPSAARAEMERLLLETEQAPEPATDEAERAVFLEILVRQLVRLGYRPDDLENAVRSLG